MPNYMLLLYAAPAEGEEAEARRAEWPLWNAVNDRLGEAGVLVTHARLEPATTVQVRGGEPVVTDGPFATTKEVLAGYYLLECADAEAARAVAAQLPLARYGSVEVRPLVEP
jgi:hypothetical protein